MKPEKFFKEISPLISKGSVIALNASPRTRGSCRTLAAMINRDIPGSSVIDLDNFSINPCIGCLKCSRGMNCVHKDDFQKLIKRITKADTILLISPVFFSGIPSQLKAVIDRCQFFWFNKLKPAKKTSGYFILTGERDRDYLYCSAKPVKAFFKTLGIKYAGDIYVRTKEIKNG